MVAAVPGLRPQRRLNSLKPNTVCAHARSFASTWALPTNSRATGVFSPRRIRRSNVARAQTNSRITPIRARNEKGAVTSACLARGLTLTLDGSVQVKRPTPVVTSYSGLADLASGYEGDER